jgi:hypothetical protein
MAGQRRVLRIRVTDGETPKVNLTVPLGLARLARVGPLAEQLSRHGIDVEELLGSIEEAADGKIVDVIEERNGERVEIYVETLGATEVGVTNPAVSETRR